MKIGITIFVVIYTLFAVVSALLILLRKRGGKGRLIGGALLLSGLGDACLLVPRAIQLWTDDPLTVWLGVGSLASSVAVTLFYLLMYTIHERVLGLPREKQAFRGMLLLAGVRIAICLLPWNGWRTNNSPLSWAIARNIPLVAMGIIIAILFWQLRREKPALGRVWLYSMLGFIFYVVSDIGIVIMSQFAALMITKAVCGMLITVAFIRELRD